MSANLRLYTAAVYSFEHVLKSAKPTAFSRKAPCAGWTGKDVYEHVMGNLAMIKSFASTGKGPKSTPKLGADPIGAWVKLREQTLEVLDHSHVLQNVANDPFGPGFGSMPVDALVGFMAADAGRPYALIDRIHPEYGAVHVGIAVLNVLENFGHHVELAAHLSKFIFHLVDLAQKFFFAGRGEPGVQECK